MEAHYLEHHFTQSFSKLVEDYLNNDPKLQDFYRFSANLDGLKEAVEQRAHFPVNRKSLVKSLKKQYEGINTTQALEQNIDLLQEENTFTICTAHQPNLLSGYLYFFYKILHAIRLSQHLKTHLPDYNFVPVFYMGSEDNDLEELGVFTFREQRYRWQTNQTGAVGRMSTSDLYPLLEELKNKIGSSDENAIALKQVITEAYQGQRTIAEATRILIHSFLGKYGILILDADDKDLKKEFIPILKEELFAPKSMNLVAETSQKLNKHYKVQAYSRPINLFYLKDGIRERIEFNSKKWVVVNTKIEWTSRASLEEEVENYPERFSPNVILRGIYQESILPNVAFIGGGSELAYWMQLKSLFDYYKVFFPAVILRQSALIMNQKEKELQDHLCLSDQDLFLDQEALQKYYLLRESKSELSLGQEQRDMTLLFENIKEKAKDIDQTLEESAMASLSKINYQFKVLEQKMLKAQKRNQSIQMNQIDNLKNHTFPNGTLQERKDNFMSYYLNYGPSFFQNVLEGTQPFGHPFLILKESK